MVTDTKAGTSSSRSEPSARVGFLTPWNQSCGLATYAKFLVSALQRQGADVVVFAETVDATTHPDEPFVSRCWQRVASQKTPVDYKTLQAQIERAQISVLHINCQARFFEPRAFEQMLAELKRSRGLQVVVQLHNLFTVAEELSSVMRHADRVLVHTVENRLEAVANGARPEAVQVVPHGVSLRPAIDPEQREALRARLGMRGPDPLIITFGFVQPHKGLESLVEAVVHLRQRGIPARGLIIGETRSDDPNSANYMRGLRDLVNRSGVADFVSFVSTFIPEELVGDYLAAADVVIMNYRSQHFEASGACALALGAGAVVMTSLAPAMMNFGDAVWHITSGYPVGLSAEMLLTNLQLRKEIQSRARQYAEQNSWERIAELVFNIHRECCRSSAQGERVKYDLQKKESTVSNASRITTARPLRVLMQNRPNTFSQRGGDTVVLERISQGLAIRGHEVTVDVEGVRDPKDFDIVHLFNFALPRLTNDLGQRAKSAGVPYVVTSLYEDVPQFHNQSHALAAKLFEYVRSGQNQAVWASRAVDLASVPRATKFAADQIAQDAAAIFVNGSGEAQALQRDFENLAPLYEVKLGHEVGPVGDEALFEREFGLRDFVLCVGRLETRKNQLMLLKALEDSDLTVVLAAGGFTYQPEYAEAVKAFKRRGQTVVLDRLSPKMLSAAYAACRIHVLPSWYELPGLVSLEAAAHGKNIVVTRTGTSADYLGDKAFYCSPADEDSIFTAVMAAYHSPVRAGLVELAKRFTWERAVDQTVEVYARVVGAGRQAPCEKKEETRYTMVPTHGFYDMSVNAMELEDALAQGEAAAKEMDFVKAEELLKKAESLDPTSARAIKGQAAVMLAQSRVDEATQLFDRALQLSSADPKILAGRGMCEVMSDRPEHALPYLEKALDISPDNLVALYQVIECAHRLQQYGQAQRMLERYLTLHPSDGEMRFCLAGCLYKTAHLEACLEQLSRVLEVKPEHEGALELRVRVQAERAALELRMVAKTEDPVAAVQGVQLLTPEGLEELSRKIQEWTVGATSPAGDEVAYAEAVPVNPVEVNVLMDGSRGKIDEQVAEIERLKRSGKMTQAKAILDEVLKCGNLSAEQTEIVGCIAAEFKVMMGELHEAATLYDRVLDHNPHVARALCGKGALAAESQDWKTAQAFFEASLDHNPRYDVALAGLGLCQMVANKAEEAFELFRAAASINPENQRAILGVLQLGYPLKRYQEMETLIQAYLKLYPSNLDMLYSFAGLLYSQGRMGEARTEVEKILVVEPKHESALELRDMLNKVSAVESIVM